MALKLLNPTELKSANSAEVTRTIARTETTRQALVTVEKKLDIAEANFEVTLSKQREVWAKENEAHAREVEDRKKEIETLEKQREPLLIPIELQRKGAHDLFVQAEQALSESRKIKADSEEVATLLQDKLDDLGERETTVAQRERKLEVRELNVQDQEIASVRLSDALTKKWQEYWAQEATSKAELAKRERAVELKEINLSSWEEFLENKRLNLFKMDISIKDRYATLLRAEKQWQTQNTTKTTSQPS